MEHIRDMDRLNTAEGLTAPENYRLAHTCRFCRHSRKEDTMISDHIERDVQHDLLRCGNYGCWVDRLGICPSYTMY